MISEILLITHDLDCADLIRDALSAPSVTLHHVTTAQSAIKALKTKQLSLAILDLQPTQMALFQEIKRLCPDLPLLLISEDSIAEALSKPLRPDLVKLHVMRLMRNPSSLEIIAASPSMTKVMEDVQKIAKTDASVFICGESGTGKEIIAKAVHTYSNRKTAPFIRVNCAALPETLIESELFGHEKGAFTGAHARRLGRFELADKGTLLLDEVTEIPLSLQSKLLRAIQEQEFERIGSMRSIKVDTRIIATSNRNMKEAIRDKIFREDLYYRLNVLPIHVAPLRERVEDILPLAEHFLGKAAAKNSRKTLSQCAKNKLLKYQWPGNIRELGNIIEHAVIMSAGSEIDSTDIHLEIQEPPEPIQLLTELHDQMTLKEMERWLIKQTLKHHNGNRTRTAKALGISIRTLRNKINTYPELL